MFHKAQWYVVSRHSKAAFMFNAVVKLYNAQTICVTLGVKMLCSPKGGPRRGGKGKWGSSNSHSHHLFGNIWSAAANGAPRADMGAGWCWILFTLDAMGSKSWSGYQFLPSVLKINEWKCKHHHPSSKWSHLQTVLILWELRRWCIFEQSD